MGVTLSTPIATARGIINDPAGVRISDVDMLEYANDAIRMMVPLVPHLFQSLGDVTCVAGRTLQAIEVDAALGISDVRRIKNGKAVLLMDSEAFSSFDPGWRYAPEAPAISWSRVGSDPLKFEIYPPSPGGQVLEVLYLRIPDKFTAYMDTTLPEVYSGPIADYIVYRAESRDDEHSNSSRAAQFMTSFFSKLKGA